MNLLFITHQGDVAGSTNSIYYLSTGLAERGHNVYMGCRPESLLWRLLQNSRVHLVPMRFKGRIDPRNIWQIRNTVKKYNIELINAQSGMDRYSAILARWLFRLPVKLIHTRRQRPKSVGGWLQNSFYTRGTDRIVVVSEEIKKMFVKKGIPPDHLVVINNGTPGQKYQNIDEFFVEELRVRHGLGKEDIVIGCVSRLKRQDQLVRSLAFLDPSIKLVLVGLGQGQFDALVAEHKISNKIIYTGTVDTRTAVHYNKLFSVAALCSISEGFSQSVLESMAMGVPVVGTRAAGLISQVQEGVNGLLYENENIVDLAEKIRVALYDLLLREKLIRNGRETALVTYSMENTLDAYEALFRKLLSK